MFVLGTAGHVDHGKSALVHALTGIDPDRLLEEKERGMTIDLGFAWLKLPSGREVGIVDVPGHERFVKNMLAGVGGIDLALLIVAANEGVMPQTREHLAILDLLGVKRGIAVITKKDLVDDEWLSIVTLEIEELIKSTSIRGSPIVAVSAHTGDGLPALLSTIDKLLDSVQPKKDIGRPRLPIDRVFTIAGSGTVITGTLLDGSLSRGQEVEIIPSGLKSRIRGLQTHKSQVEKATPGSRVAANLVGLATTEIKRGELLTNPGWLIPTDILDVKIRLLPHLRYSLRHNALVSFHSLTAEVMARTRILEKEEIKPGEEGWAQLTLENPVASIKGDRFIIRSTMETMGGGEIIDPHPIRHRRFRTAVIESLEVRGKGTVSELLIATLDTKQPLSQAALLTQSDRSAGETRTAIDELIKQGEVIALGQGEGRLLFTRSGWEHLVEKVKALVQDYHQKFPARPGLPKVELESKLKLPSNFPAALQRLAGGGVLIDEGVTIRLPSFQIQLNKEQQAKIDTFLKALSQNPYTSPSDIIPEPELLNLLVLQHRVVKVSNNVVFTAPVYEEMVKRIIEHIKKNGKVTLAEVRDLFGTSRKYAQAFMEHLDEKKITRRVGDERVLRQ